MKQITLMLFTIVYNCVQISTNRGHTEEDFSLHFQNSVIKKHIDEYESMILKQG